MDKEKLTEAEQAKKLDLLGFTCHCAQDKLNVLNILQLLICKHAVILLCYTVVCLSMVFICASCVDDSASVCQVHSAIQAPMLS